MSRIRSHEVAKAAYDVVCARKGFAQKKQYGALAHKLPAMILQNGLAQATGFLLAKGKKGSLDAADDDDTGQSNTEKINEHLALLDDLQAVLERSQPGTLAKDAALHETIIAADLQQTMLLTRHSLEACGWIKRYVQGVLRIDATGDSVDEETGDGS